MIFELKQKIRYSRSVDKFLNWFKRTPAFPSCYWLIGKMGLAETHAKQNTAASKKYFGENQAKIKQVLDLLADKRSKKILLTNIKRRMAGFWFMNGTPQDQYFPADIIHLSPDEVFVDCGAYEGDTIAVFRKLTQDRYKKIIALEPTPAFVDKIVAQQNPRCEVLAYGVWDKKDTQSFYVDGSSSIMSCLVQETGAQQITISLEKIDNLPACGEMTFLKMDIEGAELNALKGAEQTIRRQRPKLAICIYHSDVDMLEIPLWVARLNMGYKLYVRHHGDGNLIETVLYAV